MRLLRCAASRASAIPALSADAAQLLLRYTWPGNIRELDNLLQRAMILANGPVIEPSHIRIEALREVPVLRAAAPVVELGKALRGSLRAIEKRLLMEALRAARAAPK